jgi:hypothetical protein
VTGGTLAGRPAPDRLAFWQALDSGRLVLMAAAAMLAVAAFVGTAFVGSLDKTEMHTAFAFGGFIAFGELLRLALPGGRQAAPIAMVGALSYALLIQLPGPHGAHSHPFVVPANPPLVISVAAISMTVGALPHMAAGRPAGLTGMCTRLVAVSCVAFIFDGLSTALVHRHRPLELVFALLVLLVLFGWLADTVVSALIRADDVGARFSVAIMDEMRLQWPLGLAVGASVLITVFGAETMGLMELAIFIGPLLVTQVAFRRYAGIRATYLETVRSLARVTEVAGYVEEGHALRVSKLAVAVGRRLGMPEQQLLALEYAALMHDIGQLSLRDPIPAGATVLVSPADQNRIAELGDKVIREAKHLNDVAELVGSQAWPALGHEPAPPLGSMIIRAANAFDDMVGGSKDRERWAAALDWMRMAPAEYDARVVAVLTDVARRRIPARL